MWIQAHLTIQHRPDNDKHLMRKASLWKTADVLILDTVVVVLLLYISVRGQKKITANFTVRTSLISTWGWSCAIAWKISQLANITDIWLMSFSHFTPWHTLKRQCLTVIHLTLPTFNHKTLYLRQSSKWHQINSTVPNFVNQNRLSNDKVVTKRFKKYLFSKKKIDFRWNCSEQSLYFSF